jgi:ankyrin repeat protein
MKALALCLLAFFLAAPLLAQNWLPASPPTAVRQAVACSDTVWAIDTARAVLRLTRGQWASLPQAQALALAVGLQHQVAWISPQGKLLQWEGGRTAGLPALAGASRLAFQGNALWALAQGQAYRLEGAKWVADACFAGRKLADLSAGAQAGALAAVEQGTGQLLRCQGGKTEALGLAAAGMAVATADTLWAIAPDGQLRRYAGRWEMGPASFRIKSLTASRGGLWAVDADGMLLRKARESADWIPLLPTRQADNKAGKGGQGTAEQASAGKDTDTADPNAPDREGNTPLMRALRDGRQEEALRLIGQSSDFRTKNKQGNNALMLAAMHGQEEAAQRLLDRGAPLNETNEEKKSALSLAVEGGRAALARRLLEKGADPNAGNPLLAAAERRDLPMIDLLLSKRAKPDAALEAAALRNDREVFARLLGQEGKLPGNRPLELAIEQGHADIALLCLQRGGNANRGLEWALAKKQRPIALLCLEQGAKAEPAVAYAVAQRDADLFERCLAQFGAPAQPALQQALEAKLFDYAQVALGKGADPTKAAEAMADDQHLEALRFLLDQKALPDRVLAKAVERNQLEAAKLAVERGAQAGSGAVEEAVKHQNLALAALLLEHGGTPADGALMLAIKTGQASMVALLLDKGADAAPGRFIREASERGQADVVRLLLDKGAKPDEGMRAAVQYNHTRVAELLLVAGASALDPYYMERATEVGNRELVQMLVDKGANPNIGLSTTIKQGNAGLLDVLLAAGADVRQETWLALAVEAGHAEVVRRLLLAKSPASYVSPSGQTLLHLACVQGGEATVRLLLEHGLSVEAEDQGGNTPLHWAVQNKNSLALAEALVRAGADVNARNREGKLVYQLAKGSKLKKYLKSHGASKK